MNIINANLPKEAKDDIRDLQTETIEAVIKIADKYNFDRDDLLGEFAAMFSALSLAITFKDYKLNEEDS